MTAVIVGLVLAGAGAALLWRAMGAIFAQPLFARQNYRDRRVPVAAGLVVIVTVLGIEAGLTLVERVRDSTVGDPRSRLLVLVLAFGFGLLGLVDDLAASGNDRGFTGHLRALARGRLTTGGLKLAGGGLLALVVVVGFTGEDRLVWVLVDTLLIALGANTANLFDRAPGRTIKVGLLCLVPLVLLVAPDERKLLVGVGFVLGAALGLLVFDLREELMLGDTGSNVIGAVLALGLVLTTTSNVHFVALVVVLALNVASERVSFSRIIAATAPLRMLDRLGRRKDP